MNIKKLAASTAAGAVMFGTLALSVFAAAPSNGSFENGTDPGAFTPLFAGDSTSITDWTVASGSIDYIGTYWVASDGDRSIDLSGNNAGSIGQVFDTTAGAVYKVTFDMAGNPAGGPVVKTMTVDAAGVNAQYTFDTAGKTLTDMGWKSEEFVFTATGPSTTLRFISHDNTFFGPALDNVVIEQYLPSSADECKKGGWESFGVFKNQGDCVSFVATNGTNQPAL